MGNTSPHIPTPNKNVVRARLSGFVLGIGSSFTVLAGDRLQAYYLYPTYFLDLKVADHFFAPSSNMYSPDYMFDWSDSWFYAGGSPLTAVIYLDIVFCPTLLQYRVNVLSNVGFDEAQTADLAPLFGYWSPPL